MTNPTETVERRALLPFEMRQDEDGGTVRVIGYAAVFNQRADIGGMFEEVILPGAFGRAMEGSDVPFLIEHDDLPLARNTSGTLSLSQDEIGLRIEAHLDPSDPDVQRILPKMRRKDLSKMSFAFRLSEGGQDWDLDQQPPLRSIREVAELLDVSIVTHPAYEGTSIALRSLEAVKEEGRKAMEEEKAREEFIRQKERLRRKIKRDLMRVPLQHREGALKRRREETGVNLRPEEVGAATG